MLKDKINVIMSGLPGKMATKVAEQILQPEVISLFTYALTGEENGGHAIIKYKKTFEKWVELYKAHNFDLIHRKLREESFLDDIIIVDYTQPDSVNKNAESYCKYKIPFVMGTTGGDRN